MEISKEEENKILNLLTNSIQDKNYELECIIGNMNNDFVSKEDFINVLKRFKGKRKYARITSSSILSISFSNDREYALFNKKVSRVILPSNGIINVYNKTNKLDNILNNIRVERKYFDKERTIREKHKIINEDYNIRYNLKIEEEDKSVNKLFKNKTNNELNDDDEMDESIIKYIKELSKNIVKYIIKYYNIYFKKTINLDKLFQDNETMISGGILFIIISMGLYFIDITN